MGLLDLPLLIFQFPSEPATNGPCIILTISVIGDICLEFLDEFFHSKTAMIEFISFCERVNQNDKANLFEALIFVAKECVSCSLKSEACLKSWEKAFTSTWFNLKTESIRKFFDGLPAGRDKHFSRTLRDVLLLDVSSRLRDPPRPLVTTQIDWKGDCSVIIYEKKFLFRDIFECHIRAVELALTIKTKVLKVLDGYFQIKPSQSLSIL